MSVCLWTLTGLLQLHPVIAVAAFVLSEVQPSQHLWLLPLEIPRQGEFIIVNYSSSNYFTPMITGFRKKKKTKKKHGLWKDPDDVRLPVWKIGCPLHFTPYCQDPEIHGLTGPEQLVAEGSWCCHSPALLSLKLQWWSRSWALSPTRTRIYMLAFHVHFCGFGFSWHLLDHKAWEVLSTSQAQ